MINSIPAYIQIVSFLLYEMAPAAYVRMSITADSNFHAKQAGQVLLKT